MDIRDRVLESAAYILKTGATVRACAERFDVSKTTVHKDMQERLRELDPAMAKEVQAILQRNKEERHIRGGLATKKKYAEARD